MSAFLHFSVIIMYKHFTSNNPTEPISTVELATTIHFGSVNVTFDFKYVSSSDEDREVLCLNYSLLDISLLFINLLYKSKHCTRDPPVCLNIDTAANSYGTCF